MPCYYPLKAWRSPDRGKSGKRLVSFSVPSETRLELPCGQCIGCRLEYARQWAVRCMNEASLYERNCFVTLTYADEYLPASSSLDRQAFPKFMKRLRKELKGERVRFFHAGEYGGRFGRPHYHALLFGYDFPDKVEFGRRGENVVFCSEGLGRLWPFGRHELGSVSFESASYVARYVAKKLETSRKAGRYAFVDRQGNWVHLADEYATMSRRPGIGKEFVVKYQEELLRDDAVSVRGRSQPLPRYYDQVLAQLAPDRHAAVCSARRRKASLKVEAVEAAGERIEDRQAKEEVCAIARLDQSPRRLE